MNVTHSKQIAIVGAGPGGLTLARLLQMHGGGNVTVYERDSSRDSRNQGATLDLHHDSGLCRARSRRAHAGVPRQLPTRRRPLC